MWSLETAGRKVSLMGALIVGGSLCLLTLVVPQSNYIAIAALATCARFLMNGASSVCNVYIQELFPTSICQTAMGLGSTAACAASMLSPVVNLLEIYHFTIPTLVFGSLALASGIMAFLLPETRCTELPGSTEEAEGKRENNTLSLCFPKGDQKLPILHLVIVKTSKQPSYKFLKSWKMVAIDMFLFCLRVYSPKKSDIQSFSGFWGSTAFVSVSVGSSRVEVSCAGSGDKPGMDENMSSGKKLLAFVSAASP
ncbi:solute carrier family 22 member 13-like [Sinocyclocheilus grahami]|uniref:solute carrier family 22 member 13-like n=1 Tax=Sinocyclocheilus grahami TaxID=75366 RepID=UPI0007AD2420|nr:PREDICTED: solute carrier family 22 member 13-like [Sinocyclocheilus grahami]